MCSSFVLGRKKNCTWSSFLAPRRQWKPPEYKLLCTHMKVKCTYTCGVGTTISTVHPSAAITCILGAKPFYSLSYNFLSNHPLKTKYNHPTPQKKIAWTQSSCTQAPKDSIYLWPSTRLELPLKFRCIQRNTYLSATVFPFCFYYRLLFSPPDWRLTSGTTPTRISRAAATYSLTSTRSATASGSQLEASCSKDLPLRPGLFPPAASAECGECAGTLISARSHPQLHFFFFSILF